MNLRKFVDIRTRKCVSLEQQEMATTTMSKRTLKDSKMNTENLENEGLPDESKFGDNWQGVQKIKADDRNCMGDATNVDECRDEAKETDDEIEYEESEGLIDEEDEDDECIESCDNDTVYFKNNKILSLDKLETEMKEIISDVETILEVSTGISQNLLQKFRWNKETLLEKFYGSDDTNEFLMNQNVIPSDPEDFPSEENTQCDICADDESVLTGLSCNHQFCIGCWNSYLTQKIVEGGETEISCMAPECPLLFQQEQITFYINDPTVMSMYRKAVVSNYVDTNRLLKWCHGAGCEKVIKVPHASIRHVACSCGSQFCFSCNKDSHEPASCHILTHWLKMDDQESSKWILSNTKDCPKCQAPIEKNGGCNHMTCTNRNCRYEFCWLCMGDWRNHQNCNQYQPEPGSKREKHLANLERYAFYNGRYLAHQQSLNLEENLREEIKSKMSKLQEFFALSKPEVLFLQKALNALSQCRRTLMYSYVFAFYLEPNFNSIIFEANQQDLQSATEQLSEILERKLEDDDLDSLKQRIQDKYQYVETRRKCLLDHCAEGEEKDDWVYIEY